jgi:transposase
MSQSTTLFHTGIDVSKTKLDVFTLETQHYAKYQNSSEGLEQLLKDLGEANHSIVLEATGGYERLAIQHLVDKHEVSIQNPRCIRDFAKAHNRLAKNDRIDAKTIADYAKVMPVRDNGKAYLERREFTDIVARRDQLADILKSEKNRLEKAGNGPIRASLSKHIKYIDKEVKAIERVIEKHIKDSSDLHEKQKLLLTVPGIGPTISAKILAYLPELGSLDHKPLAAMVGVAPFCCDSGSMRGARRIYGGRKAVRQALYMATLVGIQYNPVIKAYYKSQVDRNKVKMKALIACMNKLLNIINAMIQNNEPWRAK